jgi:hypothetical protein
MKKKKIILLFLFGCISTHLLLFAQQQDEKRKQAFDEFKEKRVAFITKAMDLSNEEAKVFWPLCNELETKKFELNRQLMKAMRDFNQPPKEGETHSEIEYKNFVDFCADIRVKEAKLEQEYYTIKFAKVIPAKKIVSYIFAEQQFARQMLEQRGPRPENRPENRPDNRSNRSTTTPAQTNKPDKK